MDLDSTKIYGQSEAILIDYFNCGHLILTMLLYLSFDFLNVLPLSPPSLKEIGFGSFGLLDIFIIGNFYCYPT